MARLGVKTGQYRNSLIIGEVIASSAVDSQANPDEDSTTGGRQSQNKPNNESIIKPTDIDKNTTPIVEPTNIVPPEQTKVVETPRLNINSASTSSSSQGSGSTNPFIVPDTDEHSNHYLTGLSDNNETGKDSLFEVPSVDSRGPQEILLGMQNIPSPVVPSQTYSNGANSINIWGSNNTVNLPNGVLDNTSVERSKYVIPSEFDILDMDDIVEVDELYRKIESAYNLLKAKRSVLRYTKK